MPDDRYFEIQADAELSAMPVTSSADTQPTRYPPLSQAQRDLLRQLLSPYERRRGDGNGR